MSIEGIDVNGSANLNSVRSSCPDNLPDRNDKFSNILNSVISDKKTSDLDQIFEMASKRYDVPVNLLKAVAKAESDFDEKAESGAGAQGIMQLMPATAKSLGVTDSFDAGQNIMGGAKYISQLLAKFDGNTEFALAAYNAGPGSVLKYGGIPPYEETQNYVTKVMGYCGDNLTAGTVSGKMERAGSSGFLQLMLNMNALGNSYDAAPDKIADSIIMSLYQYQLQKIADMNAAENQSEDGI